MPDEAGASDERDAGTGAPSEPADPSATTRRRFLAATGAASVTAIAGCSGGDGDATTDEGPTTRGERGATPATGTADAGTTEAGSTRTTTPPAVAFDGYPYGVGERRVEDARRVMEDAGYGPDDRFELRVVSWPTHAPTFETLVDPLERAHVDLTVDPDIWFVREDGDVRAGKVDAVTSSVVADYPAAESVLRRVYPPNTDYGREDARGLALFWTEDSSHGDGRAVAAEWFDRLRNAGASTDRAAGTRDEAVRRIEEALWNDVPVVPYALPAYEALWRDRVDWRPSGTLGKDRQKNHRLAVEGDDRITLPGGVPDTLDPVTGRSSGRVLVDVFDALTNHRNATTAVEPLLIDDYSVSDDFTTYAFTLKEGVRFHDGREVTAADVVYSFRRVAESGHSNRFHYATEFLGIEHDPGEAPEGPWPGRRAAPGTLAVRATGTYEVEVDLERPFAHVLSMLALPAFSVVPEGIVGDVEGYDGEMDYETFARESPVGCGPFVLDEYARFERASVDRFEDYHGRVAELDGIDWEGLEEKRAYRAFVEGRIDFAPLGEIPVEEYDPEKVTVEEVDARGRRLGTYGPIGGGETVAFARIPTLSTDLLAFNCERVPMAVRRALAYVLDREAFVRERFETPPLPAHHLTPPALFPGGPAGYEDHYRG